MFVEGSTNIAKGYFKPLAIYFIVVEGSTMFAKGLSNNVKGYIMYLAIYFIIVEASAIFVEGSTMFVEGSTMFAIVGERYIYDVFFTSKPKSLL